MSCLVGMQLGAYVMLASDVMVYHPQQVEYREKITRTQVGLIAGCGLSDLTDDVARRLATDAPRNAALFKDIADSAVLPPRDAGTINTGWVARRVTVSATEPIRNRSKPDR